MARRAWVWTEDQVQAVQASVSLHPTVKHIAIAHGLHPKTVSNAIDRGVITRQVYKLRGVEPVPVVELIPRNCLCCGKAFNASTKFIRSCDTCREKGSPLGDWGSGVV